MSYQLVLTKAAEVEYQLAYDWYESKVVGLGLDFENEVDKSFDKISTTPELYSQAGKGYRKAIVSRFPYLIIYRIDKKRERVVIYAIFHTSRRPEKKYRKL